MQIIDANIILRYILADNANLTAQAQSIIEGGAFNIPAEVLAEVVFVLQKVYAVPRVEIAELLQSFAKETEAILPDEDVMIKALDFYASANLDFVDCMLASYFSETGAKIYTFDKKLSNFIKKLNDPSVL
jgi:predicted nucleic-acid-binding protein